MRGSFRCNGVSSEAIAESFSLRHNASLWTPDGELLFLVSWGRSQCPQVPESFGRIRTNRIIRVHIRRADNAVLIDDVTGRHRQSVFRFVIESVQSAPERLVKLAQVIRQCEH